MRATWKLLPNVPGGFLHVCSGCGKITRSEFDSSMEGHYSDEPEMLEKIERQRGEPARWRAEGTQLEPGETGQALWTAELDPAHKIYHGGSMSTGAKEPVSHGGLCETCEATEARRLAKSFRVDYHEGMTQAAVTLAKIGKAREAKRKAAERSRRYRERQRLQREAEETQ